MGLCVWLVSVIAQKLSPSLLGLLASQVSLYIIYIEREKEKEREGEGKAKADLRRRDAWPRVFLHAQTKIKLDYRMPTTLRRQAFARRVFGLG